MHRVSESELLWRCESASSDQLVLRAGVQQQSVAVKEKQ